MSLLKKFTIAHMHAAHKRRETNFKRTQTLKTQLSQARQINPAVIDEEEKAESNAPNKGEKKEKEVVTDNIATILLNMGFSLSQIMKGFKIYKFKTEEDAMNVMTRDEELGKYNHRFDQNPDNDDDPQCAICGQLYEEHIDTIFDKGDEGEKIKGKKQKGKKKEKETPMDEKLMIDKNRKKLPPIKEVKFDQELLDFFQNDKLCPICCSVKVEESDPKMKFDCGHRFCKSCISKYLETKVVNGQVLRVPCLEAGCKKRFSDEEIKHFINDTELFNKYARFKYNQSKIQEKGKNYVNCPYPDCEEVVIHDPAVLDDFLMECENDHQFCSRCKSMGWHRPEDCKKFDEELMEQIIQNNKACENVYKQCPKCGAIIEKNEGCNHMKCINCNYEFCWICLEKYEDDHYAMYNLFGCPGMKYSNPAAKKQWYENTGCKILWYILSAFLALGAFLLIFVFFLFLGCPFELIKCYITRNDETDEENASLEENTNRFTSNHEKKDGDEENIMPFQHLEVLERPLSGQDYVICFFVGLLGLVLQPFYLVFYILYGIMECYRRMSCWMYYYSF